MIWLIRRALYFWKLAHVRDTPRRLALGLACGLALGLLPKGNLLAIGLATAVFATRVNLRVATTAALLFSLGAPWLDPVAHRLGEWVLTQSALTPTWRWLYDQPIIAWTAFNNTVVMGQLLFGLAAFYPVYRGALPWFERYCLWLDSKTEPSESSVSSDVADSVPTIAAASTEKTPDNTEPTAPDTIAPTMPMAATPRVSPRRVAPRLRKCA